MKDQSYISNLMEKPCYPWIVWGLAASFFLIEYFARVGPGVMIDQLMHDFNVLAFALGSLSAFFYYAYVSMQIPVGMLVDRYSPRWLLTLMILVCAVGCGLFATATTIHLAAFGRLLMGFGSAFAFVTALKLASIWFPAYRFGLLAGLTQALGMFGAAVGQAPMAYSVAIVGWRCTMWIIAGLFVLLAIAVAFLVRDGRQTAHVASSQLTNGRELWLGLVKVLKNPQSWWNAIFAGLLYAPTEAIAELWGVKFFRETYTLSNEVAALGIGLIFIGWTIGGPLTGWLSDRIKRRKIILIASSILSLIFITIMLYVPNMPLPILFSCLFLYGVANTGLGTSYAVAAEINPRNLSGTSMAFANMASVLVGAGFQPLIGWLLDRSWDGLIQNGVPVYSAHNFRMAMITLPICFVVSALIALRVKETYCQMQNESF